MISVGIEFKNLAAVNLDAEFQKTSERINHQRVQTLI